MAKFILRSGYPYDKSLLVLIRTLRGVIGRDIRKNRERTPFVQPGRGLFGLKRWYTEEQVETMRRNPVVEEEAAEDENKEDEQ